MGFGRLYPRLRFDIGWGDLAACAVLPASSMPIEPALQSRFPGRAAVTGLSVRSLFHAFLTAKAWPAGTPIVMSAINVEGMAQIAAHHGLAIHPVDIDLATGLPPPGALIAACEASGAPLCLVAHLFGAVSPIADFAELQARGILTIEDCAQAFAGDHHCGDPHADLSLFSFGPIKRASALGGGLALCRSPRLAMRIEAEMARWPTRSEAWYRRRALRYMVLKAGLAPSLYGPLAAALSQGRDFDSALGALTRGFPGEDLIALISHRPPGALLSQLRRQLGRAHEGAARAAAWRACLGTLAPPTHAAQRHSSWLAPVLAHAPDGALSALRAAGFDATRGATSLRCLDPESAPGAARLIRDIVYLPHPAGLDARARARLTREVAALAERGVLYSLDERA